MSRAAMLPMPGDPFILKNFLLNYEAIWKEEVDMLYVCLNIDHRVPKEVRDFDIELLKNTDKVKFIVVDEMLFQGAALRKLLEIVEEDIIFSIEDDTVVVKKGQIDKCFRKIETKEADVVGSPRFSCSKEILDASAIKYGLDYTGYGDKGPNLWPNFFFARKSDLMQTDLHFEPKGWEAGDYIEELDIVAEKTISSDVFVWLSVQLRNMGLKVYEVPQYHSHPLDMMDMQSGQNIWDGQCPWIHIGSLTMTMEDLIICTHPPQEHKNTPHTEMEKMELERRYAWVLLFLDITDGYTDGIINTKEKYVSSIHAFIRTFDLSVARIKNLVGEYRRFIQW